MSARRSSGALEAQILHLLWDAEDGLTPADVHDRLGAMDQRLAYTTVMTVLSRLRAKGDAVRVAEGRTFRYRPARSEAETAASRMRSVLDATDNRRGALANFVAELSTNDEAELRDLLRQLEG
jgi:predicted transcriptional regulator